MHLKKTDFDFSLIFKSYYCIFYAFVLQNNVKSMFTFTLEATISMKIPNSENVLFTL